MALPDNLASLAASFLGDSDNQLLARPGYQKFPSGLIIQWGIVTGHATPGTAVAVTYPIPFPTACRGVSATVLNTTASAGYCWTDGGSSTTGFNYRASAASIGAFWVAIGN